MVRSGHVLSLRVLWVFDCRNKAFDMYQNASFGYISDMYQKSLGVHKSLVRKIWFYPPPWLAVSLNIDSVC